MKEFYYTPDIIRGKAEEMLESSSYAARRRESGIVPKRPALLVLDMQAYFLESESHAFVPSGRAIIPVIKNLINAFHASKMPVIFTRHENTPENAGQMGVWWREILLPGHPLGGIIPELEPDGHRVITKSQYDAFYKTDLSEVLQGMGVTQVVVTGLMAHLCCETTARSAFMRGYEVYFLVDGTASYEESLHKAALLSLSHGFATLVLAEEVLSSLESPSASK